MPYRVQWHRSLKAEQGDDVFMLDGTIPLHQVCVSLGGNLFFQDVRKINEQNLTISTAKMINFVTKLYEMKF